MKGGALAHLGLHRDPAAVLGDVGIDGGQTQPCARPLRVNLDLLELFSRSHSIRDLLGLRRTLNDCFSGVRQLLEETYAIANQFYHDETGAYFLFPYFEDTELGELLEEIRNCFPPDLRSQVHVEGPVRAAHLDRRSEDFDREAVQRLVAAPRNQARQDIRTPVRSPHVYPWHSEWNAGVLPPEAEQCTVCGMRPVGYPWPTDDIGPEDELGLPPWATSPKARERHLCRACLHRRGRRSEEWATGDLTGTIWISEVADNSGRVALVLGLLDLEGWLDGSLLNSIWIAGRTWKSPSPARLYRIAETGRRFWKEVVWATTPDIVGNSRSRLGLCPKNELDLKNFLGPYHAYQLLFKGIAVEAVWDGKRFISCENLEYLAKRHGVKLEELPNFFNDKDFQVRERAEVARGRKAVAQGKMEAVMPLDEFCPTIPIVAEPGLGMILVPANKALEVAQAIKNKYVQEMGRVRDRLPLHLGLVFFPRRTPIRAVLEAGRRMMDLKEISTWEEWKIVKVERNNATAKIKLRFDNGVAWEVPLKMPDGATEDKWYGHFATTLPDGKPTGFKKITELRGLDPNNLQGPGSNVFIRPGRFDFEFLDTTARRFEISYKSSESKVQRRNRPTRPFLLDDLERLGKLWEYLKKLKSSQRHQVVQAIEATREAWFGDDPDRRSWDNGVFRQFVRDTLAGAEWPKHMKWSRIGGPLQEALVIAGVKGELADLLELHMAILQEPKLER